MSRALDLLLLALVGLAAVALVRSSGPLEAGSNGPVPLNATVRVTGDASLLDLGLLLRPADGLQVPGSSTDDIAPHQLAPWQSDRTTQILVPLAGQYSVRWGIQDQGKPPRRPRDVLRHLAKDAKVADQVITITPASSAEILEIQLTAEHADAIRAQSRLESIRLPETSAVPDSEESAEPQASTRAKPGDEPGDEPR